LASSIPLIRASALVPSQLWLQAQGFPAAETFRTAGLPACPSKAPNRLVSFHGFFGFLAEQACVHGPDFGARISTPEALMELGAPAIAVRASRTVREALLRAGRIFHRHASHVFFLVKQVPTGLEVTAGIPITAPPETHHQGQQHIAGFVCALGLVANGLPLPARVRMVPHPVHGLDHLRRYLGDDLQEGAGQRLHMHIPNPALDLALPWEPVECLAEGLDSLESVTRGSLADSARILIKGMVEDGNPEMDRLALCAGRSRRTMQRLLANEGTSFAELLDSIRREAALAQLTNSSTSMSDIAGDVGYRSASSLTRAVRRWTATNPRRVRGEITA
jgi:AraC-like DNA-binding protein